MKKQKLFSKLGYLTPWLGLALAVFLQVRHLAHWQKNPNVNYAKEEQSLKFALDVQRKLPSFGFSNLIADWTFLKYVQYYGDGVARQVTGYQLIPDFFETMVSTDPRFVQAYLSLSTANSIFAGRPDKTVSLMNRVIKAISPKTSPLAYYIWIYKGFDEILFLGDLKAAQHSYEMASKWARIAGAETSAANTQATAQFLASNPDPKTAQISAWAMILTTVPDLKTKEYASAKIKELGGKVIVNSSGKIQVKMPNSI
ncbi:MAG: hypothetical protein ACKO2V_24325 [Snowella sp.]